MRNTAEHPVTYEGDFALYWGGPFSNFTFVEDGLSYPDRLLGDVCVPTVEHAYQGAKTLDPIERLHVHGVNTPLEALRAGRKLDLRADWPTVKMRTMAYLCRRRLRAEPALLELLLSIQAEGYTVAERHPYWGKRTGYIWSTLGHEARVNGGL